MAGLGIVLSTVLALANKKLHVEEDPRIDVVEDMLPLANCGACGTAGCRAFAEAVVSRALPPSKCPVNSPEMTERIARFLGVDAGTIEKQVARLACAGGNHVAWFRARYQGMGSCTAAQLVSGGGKGCAWGCLGYGDCVRSCQFGAIHLNDYGLPVVDEEKCTACGACVEIVSAKTLVLEMQSRASAPPVGGVQEPWREGDAAEAECEVACTGLRPLCDADVENGSMVSMVNNLATCLTTT